MVDDLADEDEAGGTRFTAEDVARAAQNLQAKGDWSAPTEPTDLGSGIRWLPHLESRDRSAIAHVHLGARLESYLTRRLRLASEKGISVHVALPAELLWDRETLRSLSRGRFLITLLDEELRPQPSPVLFLRALAEVGIALPPDLVTEFAGAGWSSCRDPKLGSHEKGRALEALLGFLLSQVADFRVMEFNLRTDTEELDVVVQVRRLDGERCWVAHGTPFVVVEAKNWSTRVRQPEVSALYTKLVTKRRNARLALLVGAQGFTADAAGQVMKLSLGDVTIVLLGPDEIEAWIAGGESYLDKHVRRGMLR